MGYAIVLKTLMKWKEFVTNYAIYVLAATKKSVSVFPMQVLTVQDNMMKNVFVILITFSTTLNVFKKGSSIILKTFKLRLIQNSIQSK